MLGPSAMHIELTDGERVEFEGRIRQHKASRADALRAESVLLPASGMTSPGIAQRLGITRVTVTTWRKRFAAFRLEGLGDEPRPDAPRKIDDEKITELVTATLEQTTFWLPSSGSAAALPNYRLNLGKNFRDGTLGTWP